MNATERAEERQEMDDRTQEASVDLTVSVGGLTLRNPVMAASGPFGRTANYTTYVRPAELGAVVMKTVTLHPRSGNPEPQIHHLEDGSVLNSIGLENAGIHAWASETLPRLLDSGATVVASLWADNPDEYGEAAGVLAEIQGPAAFELNLSCPNHGDPRLLIAHDDELTRRAVSAVRAAVGPTFPLWAKLSPNTTDLVEIAEAAAAGGANAVTLVNTFAGMAIDLESRRPLLGNRYGGISGPALHGIALRAVHQVHDALPDLPIIGVGGISTGEQAVAMMMAGACAVQVGTANLYDSYATHNVLSELEKWCESHRTTPESLSRTAESQDVPGA